MYQEKRHQNTFLDFLDRLTRFNLSFSVLDVHQFSLTAVIFQSPKLLKVDIKLNAIFLSSPFSPTLRYWENIGPVLCCCCFVLFACPCCCCFVCLFCKVNKLASAHFISLKKKNTNKKQQQQQQIRLIFFQFKTHASAITHQ